MLTSVNKLLLLHTTIHAKLHMPLLTFLTMSNFTHDKLNIGVRKSH